LRAVVATLVLFSLVSACAAAVPANPRPQSITVAIDDNYPPYSFHDSAGRAQGISKDYWTLWEQRTGIKVNLQAMDWAKAQQLMLDGKADVIDTISITESRKKIYDFLDPYATFEVPIFFHKSISGITGPDSLRGFTVGVKDGDACIEKMLESNDEMVLKKYPSHEALVRAAGDGEVRVFCMGKPSASYFLYKLGIDRDFRVSAPVYVSTFHRAVHKGDLQLLGIVRDGFEKITDDERKQIEEKWLGAPLLKREALELARKVGYVLLVVIVFALALAIWNLALRRRVSAKTEELSRTLAALSDSNDVAVRTLDRLTATLEAIPDLLFELDSEGRYYSYRAARVDQLLAPPEQLLGRTVTEVMPPEAADTLLAVLREASEKGFSQGALIHLELEGGTSWFELSAARKKTSSREGERFIVLSREITERKAAQQQQQASEHLYRTLTENHPDCISRLDVECRHIFVNDAAQRLAGLTAESMLGRTFCDFPIAGNPETLMPLLESCRQVVATATPHSLEFCWPNGRVTESRHFPEMGECGDVVSVLVIAQDITERKRFEEALRESENTLRELVAYSSNAREEERKHIAREIHDELGQMLTAQRLDIAMLKFQYGADNPALAERCQRLMELADKTIQVVRNVALALRPAALDMGAAAALEGLASEFMARTGISCRLHFGGTEMTLDEERLIAMFRIVQESLTNVTRHAQAKHVDITLSNDEASYLLSIRDDGQGFDPERVRGNSFGLVGIRERALMMGGEARFVSAPGCGTEIQVRIPINRTEGTLP
jgi:PAS domain S-box-containing protein